MTAEEKKEQRAAAAAAKAAKKQQSALKAQQKVESEPKGEETKPVTKIDEVKEVAPVKQAPMEEETAPKVTEEKIIPQDKKLNKA